MQPWKSPSELGFSGVHPLGLMPTSTGTALAPLPAHRKSAARVALFDLPDTSAQLVTECFRQFGIETASIARENSDRLQNEKFEACVLTLGEGAGSIIERARGSASNSRIVLYGLRGSVTWKKSNNSFGVRFESSDERRQRVKDWIVAYLEA